jgi:hypothetical protein
VGLRKGGSGAYKNAVLSFIPVVIKIKARFQVIKNIDLSNDTLSYGISI